MAETTGPPPATVPDAFAAAVTGPYLARPLLTWYDDSSGDRAELSGATLANWVAKTANLVVDGCGLGPGDLALVDAPPHWQTAVVLIGCWSAGLRAVTGAAGPDVEPDLVFATAAREAAYAGSGADRYGLALAPLAAPMIDPPAGLHDFVREVRAYGDHFQPALPVTPDDPATLDRSHGQLCRAAAQRAEAHGIGAGTRVLVDATVHPDPLDWLVAPLLAGASLVLCANLDPTGLPARLDAERVAVALT